MFFIAFIISLYVCEHICRGHRTTLGSQFSPSITWVPGFFHQAGQPAAYLLSHLSDSCSDFFQSCSMGFSSLFPFSFYFLGQSPLWANWPKTHYMFKGDLLPSSFNFWDYKYVPPCLSIVYFFWPRFLNYLIRYDYKPSCLTVPTCAHMCLQL